MSISSAKRSASRLSDALMNCTFPESLSVFDSGLLGSVSPLFEMQSMEIANESFCTSVRDLSKVTPAESKVGTIPPQIMIELIGSMPHSDPAPNTIGVAGGDVLRGCRRRRWFGVVLRLEFAPQALGSGFL